MNEPSIRRWSWRLAAAVLLGGACLLVAPRASAEGDASAAETLFLEGVAAMKKNDFVVACEAFARSNKVDPSPGTQINLALCHEKQKKWATAWTWYRSAAGLAQQRGQVDREKLALDAAAKLKPQLHNVIISVKEPLTERVVKRDGVEVEIELAGREIPLPIDPGEHKIEVAARGKRPWSKVIRIAEDPGTDRIEVPRLEDAAPEPKASVAPALRSTEEPRPAPVVEPDGSGRRLLGIIAAGAGIAAGATAVGFYLVAVDQDAQAERLDAKALDPTLARDKAANEEAARSKHDAASTDQLAAIVLGAGAGALVAIGAVLYFTAPSGSGATTKARLVPTFGPGHAGVGLGGTF